MALLDIANEDLLVNAANLTGPPDLVYVGDTGIDLVKIVPIKSLKTKATNKYICNTSITLAWLPPSCMFTSATHTFVSGSGIINATAIKTKDQTLTILRKDDAGVCIGGWLDPGLIPVPCSCNIKISNAGQIKAKAQ